MPVRIVFYSWQSDIPSALNRGFIENALQRSAKAIAADATLEVELRVDTDAAGASGAPAIADEIFKKIDRSDVFVADVTDVTVVDSAGRRMPNPNVLLELGYAAKSLGWERILLVRNEAFGRVEDLPFDLRGRRVVNYRRAADDASRQPERDGLASRLEASLREILVSPSPAELVRVSQVDDSTMPVVSLDHRHHFMWSDEDAKKQTPMPPRVRAKFALRNVGQCAVEIEKWDFRWEVGGQAALQPSIVQPYVAAALHRRLAPREEMEIDIDLGRELPELHDRTELSLIAELELRSLPSQVRAHESRRVPVPLRPYHGP
ncbi:MAG: nucleotide-binding protein [Nannocystaceae bacterium]